ncbi:MAG TPA: hypothetical protein PLV45_11775 [bacterium]|nr:hypothetical protein [bacterium]
MFKKDQQKPRDENVVMQIVQDGKVRNITLRELVLSQNLSLEALTSVLIRKGLITPDDLLEEIDRIRRGHTRKTPESSES